MPHEPRASDCTSEPIESLELVRRCAEDTNDEELWTEFIRRFGPKIKQFIRGTLGVYSSGPVSRCGAAEEADLFQSTMLRLVSNDCAPLRRFTGQSEADFLAYLAIVSRSAVRDFIRRHHKVSRFREENRVNDAIERVAVENRQAPGNAHHTERRTLIREVERISSKIVGNQSSRDRLIFELYYSHNLSAAQIAECKGVGLKRPGVEKVLDRLTTRVRRAAAGPEPAQD